MNMVMLLEIACKSALLAGAALLVLQLCGRRSASERSWVAHLGMLAVLVAPLAGELMPRWFLTAPAAGPAAVVPADAHVTILTGSAVVGAARPVASSDLPTDIMLAGLYALPALLLVIGTLVSIARLFTLRRRAEVIVDQPWLSALAHAQRRMQYKNGAALLVSRELRSPISWGLVRPTIVINEATLASNGHAEAVLAHELAHVARFDWCKLLLTRVTTALFWFNPLVWVLASQCHQLREEAADDAVLRSDVDQADYASLLVKTARHENRGVLLAAHGVAPGRDSLRRRVVRVLDTSRARAPVGPVWSLACVGFGIAIGAPLAAITTREAPLEPVSVAVTSSPAEREEHVEVKDESQAGEASPARQATIVATAPITPPSPPAAPLAPVAPLPPKPPLPAAPPKAPAPPALGFGELQALASSGISPADYTETVRRYPQLGLGEVIALNEEGISLSWLRDMQALGYRGVPFQKMLAMGAHGVTPRFVREMAAQGYSGLTADQLIAMAIHDVTPRFAADVIRQQRRRPTASELISIAIVGPELAAGARPSD